MFIHRVRNTARLGLVGAALAALQACSNISSVADNSSVTQAYSTSNVVAIQPYTRTIFSSNNF